MSAAASDQRKLPWFLPVALGLAAAAFAAQWLRGAAQPEGSSGALAAALAPYLAWKRLKDRPERAPQALPAAGWAAAAAGLILAPAFRLALEPFPGWPLAEWALAVALAIPCLALIAAGAGADNARHFAFPLGFAFAALPWPAALQSGLVGRLRIGLARLVAEVSGLLGEPAQAEGTTIRLGHLSVGIEEACGGVHSLQAAFIFALAAGELRRDRRPGRLAWVVFGVALALLANAVRLAALVWIGGRRGAEALAAWHGRADWLELTFVLGGFAAAWLIAPRPAPRAGLIAPRRRSPGSAAGPLARALIASVLAGEAAARIWFGGAEGPDSAAARWEAQLPRSLPSYADDAFAPVMQDLLGCDRHELGHWQNAAGARRAGSVLEWGRGTVARSVLLGHNPDVCLPDSGSALVRVRPPLVVDVGRARLPFARRVFQGPAGEFRLYFLAWDAAAGRPLATGELSPLRERLREIADRRRASPVRAVAVAVYDEPDDAAADRAFVRESAGLFLPSP